VVAELPDAHPGRVAPRFYREMVAALTVPTPQHAATIDRGRSMVPLGIRIYGLGAMVIGVVGLVWGDFALQWQPVAAGFPGRTTLAYIFSAALVVAGALVNGRATSAAPRSAVPGPAALRPAAVGSAAVGSAALAALYAVVVIFMHGPQIFQHPGAFPAWDGAAEQLALLAGGLAAYAYLSGADSGLARPSGLGLLGPPARLARISVIMMGVCLLMFGLAHFLYLDFTASMVPAWLPGGQKLWAAVTGAGHLAAGIAFLTGVKARLAAIALTVMFAVFGALVHLPLLLADPHSHLGWVMNAINLALTGAAWALATLLQSTPAAIRS
jgi:uncharacterized membrane protein YphA (DoxX/SURF4 family)